MSHFSKNNRPTTKHRTRSSMGEKYNNGISPMEYAHKRRINKQIEISPCAVWKYKIEYERPPVEYVKSFDGIIDELTLLYIDD